jgi:hypothetical protein
MVDTDFKIVQVGDALPDILLRDYDELIGQHVNKVLTINRPLACITTIGRPKILLITYRIL